MRSYRKKGTFSVLAWLLPVTFLAQRQRTAHFKENKLPETDDACRTGIAANQGSQGNRLDFDDAMKRFLVRTAVCVGSERSAGMPPPWVSRADYIHQITILSCGKPSTPITTAHNQHIRSHLTERQSMARVTVEDCIDKVDNRFDLVLLAAHRARMISSGSQLTVDRDNDKNPVVSLREIADSTISPEDLREELVHSLQKFVEVDEPEPDTVPLIGSAGASVDADDTEVAVERMTEEELLKGLEGLAPPEEQPEEDE